MTGFLDELRRRHVTKTAAVYAVAAWVIIEASAVIFPALHLPSWTVTFVVVLALIGFPVVLIFSWVFDFTREGIVRTPGVQELPPEQAAGLSRGRAIDFVIIAVLLGVIGWLGWERAFDREDSISAALDSIAVLPFVNMSGNPENEYFGDGLAEELLNALVRVEGLRVAARTSSFEYKGQNLDIRRIGEALNVATVLEGSVRRSGNRLRVTAQLIRADDGFHLWSDTYDRDMQDIFAMQDDISLAIVDALKVTLGAQERAAVTTHSTMNVAALEAYMRGRFEMNKRTGAALRRAIDHFEEAVRIDPGYARAYSGLSDSWILLGFYGGLTVTLASEQAEPHARRALELDNELAEAHASLGLILRHKEDIAGSIMALERAIALNPGYSPAYHWLGLSYSSLGRLSEAERVLRRAVEIDPQYLTGKRALGGLLRHIGKQEEARELWARIVREHPSDPLAWYGLAADASVRGEPLEAFRHIIRAVELAPRDTEMRAALVLHLIPVHDFERAQEQVDVILGLEPNHVIGLRFPVNLAFATLQPDAVEAALRASAGWPQGLERAATLCNLTVIAERWNDAEANCAEYARMAGWDPETSELLTNQAMDAVASLMFVASRRGEEREARRLLNLIDANLRRLEEAGLDSDELAWVRALLSAHGRGDTGPLLEILPLRLRMGGFNLAAARRQPIFRPLHGDPRFEAMLDEALKEVEVMREQMARIPIPDP